MPFLDWVNKNQAKAATREVPYHWLKQEASFGAPSDNLLIQEGLRTLLKAAHRGVSLRPGVGRSPIGEALCAQH